MMMRTAIEWLTPVKASGMAAYLIAAASCGMTAVIAAGKRVPRLAAVLCALDLTLFFDITFDLRWKLYALIKGDAVRHGVYSERSGPQVLALMAVAIGVLVAVAWLSRRFASIRGAPLAICGGLLSIGCWFTEIISLHAVDAILYHNAGPLMVVSFVWMLACAMTIAGIVMAQASSFRYVTPVRTNR
jgi:hypothetical protein